MLFPNTLCCNGTSIKIIFVDNKTKLILHRNLSFEKEELQIRIIESRFFLLNIK